MADFDESVSMGISVCTSDVVGPVANRIGTSSPHAPFSANSRSIDIVALKKRKVRFLSSD